MSWAEVVEAASEPVVMPVAVPPPQVLPGPPVCNGTPPVWPGVAGAAPQAAPVSRIYVRNLHGDTSQDDLYKILEPLTTQPVTNLFISKLQRNRRWAKFELPAADADFFIGHFNLLAGVLLGQAAAEYARS